MRLNPDPFVKAGLWVLLGLITLAAITSEGFYFFDEHYQVLEFANVWLGHAPATDLPWEYFYKIRSWLQPAVLALPLGLFELVGVTDPHTLALGARLFSGLIVWVACVGLTDLYRNRIEALGALSFFALPYLAVRTASESFGAALLISAAAMVGRAPVVAGALFWAAVLARLQLAAPVAALMVWAWIYKRAEFVRRGPRLALGAGMMLAVGLILDRIGYGVWTFSPWNYFSTNVIDGVASRVFGTSPWWQYGAWLVETLHSGAFVLIAAFVWQWVREPKSALTWATAAFIAVHVITPHKELRFLFPLFLVAGLLLGRAVKWAFRFRRANYALALAAIVAQATVGVWIAQGPNPPQLPLLRIVTREPTRIPLVVEQLRGQGLGGGFRFIEGLKTHFYNREGIKEFAWPKDPAAQTALVSEHPEFWLMSPQPELEDSRLKALCIGEAAVPPMSLWRCRRARL